MQVECVEDDSFGTVQFMGHGGSGGSAQWLDCGARTISGYRCWGGGMVDRIALACADLRSHTDTRFWAGDGCATAGTYHEWQARNATAAAAVRFDSSDTLDIG